MTTALKGSVQTTEGNVVPFPSGANELDDVKLPTTGRTAGSVPLNGRLRPNTFSMTNCVPDTLTQKAADPIKSIADIDKVCNFLLSHKRYRDYMMFVVGINFGLRVSDLTRLRFQDLINNDMTFKSSIQILEQKTKDTRKNQKLRYITINQSVIDAVNLYIQNAPVDLKLDDYMFRSESPNKKGEGYETGNAPLTTTSVNRILKKIAKDCNLNIKMSSHTLRKTFGYHQMAMDNNDPRKLMLLSKMFGHSTTAYTLMYIGLTKEEMDEAYLNLNLGGNDYSRRQVSAKPVENAEGSSSHLGRVRFRLTENYLSADNKKRSIVDKRGVADIG